MIDELAELMEQRNPEKREEKIKSRVVPTAVSSRHTSTSVATH